MPEHTVKQGEYLAKIAKDYGFSSYKTIWQHDKNKDLRDLRKDPNILYPGDVVFIPEKQTMEDSRATDKRWKYQFEGQPQKLRIVVKDVANKPVADRPCELKVTGASDIPDQTTDGNGLVERPIAATAEEGKLLLKDESLPIDLDIPLMIGHLDPVDTVTGWQARLNNLGYDAGEVDGQPSHQLQSAIEEFQCDHNLQVDGKCGSLTQAKLKEVHGC